MTRSIRYSHIKSNQPFSIQFRSWRAAIFSLLAAILVLGEVRASTFILPTPNDALLKDGTGGEAYFVGTVGRTWESGTFGCVRTEGHQMHEGLDIRATRRDKKGEATDPIFASAAGSVAYINSKVGLSNYGRYIILRHTIEGIPVYTTYAHLSAIADGLKVGDSVKQGEVIATMGRSSNTRQGISKERAHLHFEITLRLNDRFTAWHNARLKGQRNDHGVWNGRNFLGLDPREVLVAANQKHFSLLEYIRNRTELCRVFVRDTSFPWIEAYTPLIRRNPVADQHGVVGYEIALDYNGVPFQLIPRAAQEIEGKAKIQILSVNEKEQAARVCRKLVSKRSGKWQLGSGGSQLLDLLTW